MSWELTQELLKVGLLGFVALWGLIRWRWDKTSAEKMQERQEKLSREIEDLKAEYARRQTIHSIAFETKFKVYQEIWKSIYKLQSISPITPSLDQLPMDAGEKKKEYERRLEAAYEAFREAVNILELKKPFYPTKIYDLARQLSRLCLKHIIGIKNRIEVSESDSKQMNECYEMADKLEDDAKDMIEKVEQAIRDETKGIGKAEIVG